MNIIMDLVTNRILVATAAAWFVAQFLKVLFDTIKNGFSVERLTGSGGMPSSHSATVTGLVVSTAMVEGVGGFPVSENYDRGGCDHAPRFRDANR